MSVLSRSPERAGVGPNLRDLRFMQQLWELDRGRASDGSPVNYDLARCVFQSAGRQILVRVRKRLIDSRVFPRLGGS